MIGRFWCTYDMEPIRRDGLFEPDIAVSFDTASPTGLSEYLAHASSICALFSYLSSIVVRKSRWDAVGPVEPFIGSAYAHSAKMLAILTEGARVSYLPGPLVYCRGDNDHFLEHGAFNRVRIDFAGYARLFERYLPDEHVSAKARHVMRREYGVARLLLVVSIASREELRELRGYLRHFGYPGWVRATIAVAAWRPVRVLLKRVVPSARRVWWWRQRRSFRSREHTSVGNA